MINTMKPQQKTTSVGQPVKGKADTDGRQKKQEQTNRSWEAFGKSRGCFTVNDPQFFL